MEAVEIFVAYAEDILSCEVMKRLVAFRNEQIVSGAILSFRAGFPENKRGSGEIKKMIPAISKHLKNIFESGELLEKTTVSKMETVRSEGRRDVRRDVDFYNLDAIIAVGYRVNSYQATQFRIWATKTLKEYTTKGQEDLDVPPKMERLKQWCEDINRVQSKAIYDFVFVDDEGFEKYRPKTFKSLMDGFAQYQ